MKNKIEVFYDYLCPFCYRGLAELNELLTQFPDAQLEWKPCEAHPRPEYATVHSDLAIQTELYLAAHGGDVPKFNRLAFGANFEEGKRIDDIEFLAQLAAECGVSHDDVLKALRDDAYGAGVLANNELAWDTLGLEAVPSYRCGDEVLGSSGGVLVPKEKVFAFLEKYGK